MKIIRFIDLFAGIGGLLTQIQKEQIMDRWRKEEYEKTYTKHL